MSEHTQQVSKAIYRSVGLIGDRSFTLVLPKDFARNLRLKKGEFVKVTQEDDKILVERAE